MTDHSVLNWERVDNMLVVVNGTGSVPDSLWEQLVRDMDELPIDTYLGISMGTIRVTSVQRQLAADVAKKRGLSTIILTNDRLVRGLVTAVSWLGADIKAYPSGEMEEVLSSLELGSATRAAILEASSRLGQTLTKQAV